jgi:hypothetical protein
MNARLSTHAHEGVLFIVRKEWWCVDVTFSSYIRRVTTLAKSDCRLSKAVASVA